MGWGWVRACVPSRPAPPHHRRLACYLLPATCCLLLAACYLLLALLAACCLLLAAAASCCLLLLFAASPDAYCCCLCCRLPPSPTRSSLFPFRCSESLSCLRCDGPAMRQGRPAASDLRDVVGIPRELRGLSTSPWVHHEHAPVGPPAEEHCVPARPAIAPHHLPRIASPTRSTQLGVSH